MWLLILTSFFLGMFFVLFLEVMLLYRLWINKPQEKPSHEARRTKVKNPEDLTRFFKKLTELPEEDIKERLRSPETCVCLNVIFAFLWKEWRDSPDLKRIFISKLTREFNDLIGSKATKGIIDEIKLKSYSFGDSLPIIKDAALINIKSKSAEDVPDEIDVALNISYSGGFYVSADFALALSKSVYLSIKIVEISGKVKLSFRRNPLSHWSFSFFEDPKPKLELDAESRLEGKNFQQLTSLITRHFKKVFTRKYILPNYIIRYKPFLRKKAPQDAQKELWVHNYQVTVGSVLVQVISCSRLPLQKKIDGKNWVFCSLFVDTMPFAERKNVDPSLWPIGEFQVLRNTERRIGLTFHEVLSDGDNNHKTIIVDSIDQDSPVGHSSLKVGDIILEINGTPVNDAKQASKLIRTSNRRLSILVKRPPSHLPAYMAQQLSKKVDLDSLSISEENTSEIDETDALGSELLDIVIPMIQMDGNPSLPAKGKSDDTISLLSLPLRGEIEKSGRFSDGSPHSSPIMIRKTLHRNAVSEDLYKAMVDDEEKMSSDCEKKTKCVRSSKNPRWSETFELQVGKDHKYLSVLVWYQIRLESFKDDGEEQRTKDILLGYVTIPLIDIAVQCLETGDRFHQQEFVLVSTAYDKVLASRSHLNGHPGLNRVSCGGDITLGFIYQPSFDNDDDACVVTKVHTCSAEDLNKDTHSSVEHLDSVEFSYEGTQHSFVDTQFYYPTKCDFCTKKIWTKSGYRCRLCGMPCHKKCLQRAEMYTQCYSHYSDSTKQGRDIENASIELDAKTLKEHGINPSEITSMKDMSSAVKKIKMIGQDLYADLPAKARKAKLEEMIDKLQREIDEENEKKAELYAMKNSAEPAHPISRIEQQITRSERKCESLKFLMLQYCSGLGSCDLDQ